MVEFTQGRTSTICHGRYLDITLARQTCPATPLLEADQRPLQMAAILSPGSSVRLAVDRESQLDRCTAPWRITDRDRAIVRGHDLRDD